MTVYLNNAGQARLSPAVEAEGCAAVRRPPWSPDGVNDQQRVRELFASLIEAESRDIAIMASTAFAITLAARNVQRSLMNKSGKILLLQDQFMSAVYPWQQICEESNGSLTLEIVPYPELNIEDGWTKAIMERLDENILVACLPPLHWANGALVDLEKIGEACEDQNIPLIVDATQAVGIMPVSVKRMRPTFLACSIHKWLRAPSGASCVYVSEEVRASWIPLDLHARGRDLPSDVEAVKNEMEPTGYPEKFFSDARKFDSGGKPNPIILSMLRVALEEVVQVDVIEAQQLLNDLMKPLIQWARANGYDVSAEPRAYHLIGVEPVGRTPKEVVKMADQLKENGIIVATRCGGLRVSPYLDTKPSEIRRLIKELEVLNAVYGERGG